MLNSASSNRTKDARFSGPKCVFEGKIISFTKVWMACDDFFGNVPYFLALIELSDGTKTVGQVVDACELKSGIMVEACMRKISMDGKNGIIEYGTKFRVIK